MLNDWKQNLTHVFGAFDCAGLSPSICSMGGGTALMYFLRHRLSKDIDIFFEDLQHLNFFLPQLNGYLEDISSDYSFLSNFIKIRIGNQEIDFIFGKNITGIEPSVENIDGRHIRMESPLEIIAKKIFYRHDHFTPRDVFDLAMVYHAYGEKLVPALSVIDKDVFAHLAERIRKMAHNELSLKIMADLVRLPGSKAIGGREFALSIEFADIMCSRDPEHSDPDTENTEQRSAIRP